MLIGCFPLLSAVKCLRFSTYLVMSYRACHDHLSCLLSLPVQFWYEVVDAGLSYLWFSKRLRITPLATYLHAWSSVSFRSICYPTFIANTEEKLKSSPQANIASFWRHRALVNFKHENDHPRCPHERHFFHSLEDFASELWTLLQKASNYDFLALHSRDGGRAQSWPWLQSRHDLTSG